MAEFRPEAAFPVASVETPRAGGGPEKAENLNDELRMP
jgi:hypothetical protein